MLLSVLALAADAQLPLQALDVERELGAFLAVDTRFPEWNPAEWRLVACEAQNCGARYPYPFTFETYLRR